MAYIINGREVSGCICGKAKHLLGLPTKYTGNKKTCSQLYWDEIIDHFALQTNLSAKRIKEIKQQRPR